MNDRPKTPGQVCYEAGPKLCNWDDLFPAEREGWEKRAAAVTVMFNGPVARPIGIGDKPPPPPPPPPAAPPANG